MVSLKRTFEFSEMNVRFVASLQQHHKSFCLSCDNIVLLVLGEKCRNWKSSETCWGSMEWSSPCQHFRPGNIPLQSHMPRLRVCMLEWGELKTWKRDWDVNDGQTKYIIKAKTKNVCSDTRRNLNRERRCHQEKQRRGMPGGLVLRLSASVWKVA